MTVSTGIRHSLAQLHAIVPPGRGRTIWLLALLTAVSAVSEVVAIGSVVPFLALLAGSPNDYFEWLPAVFEAIGADTRSSQLVAATAFLCVAAFVAAALRITLVRKTQEFAFRTGHEISVEVQRRMLIQPYSWHLSHNSSDQLATITKVELVATAVLLPLMQAVAAAILIVVVLVALLQIAPVATLLAGFGLGLAYYALGLHARRRLHSNSQKLRTSFEQRIRVLQEGLGGIRDVILEGSHSDVLSQFRSADSKLARARANSAFISAVPRYLIEPAGIVLIAGLALYLAQREGGLATALPVLGAVALGAQRLLPLVQQLYHGWSSVAANRAVVDDVVQRLELSIPTSGQTGVGLAFTKDIAFRDVSFAYQGSDEPSISDLAFTLRRGSRIALVGPTGSGKSTTADLLMGLLEPTAGSIAVDGVTLDDSNRQAWRANVAHVPQILFLADASIAQNIAMTAELDLERVREAAALAHLDEFAARLPKGYDSRVGERGARISGGQRQRLALARAIYKNAPLLVLDEATSALDSETETAIGSALDVLQKRGCTIVIIAHRSKLIATCDGLIRLAKGRIVECTGAAVGGDRD